MRNLHHIHLETSVIHADFTLASCHHFAAQSHSLFESLSWQTLTPLASTTLDQHTELARGTSPYLPYNVGFLQDLTTLLY